MIILFVAIFATLTEADYDKSKPVSCNNWKKMDEPCPGCVFKTGDMEGKCKRTGQYFDPTECEAAGGVWCKLTFTCLKLCTFYSIITFVLNMRSNISY